MACSHIDTCELFVQFALNPALDIWKHHYCEGDFKGCSRFKISKTGRQIPLTLLPNGTTIEPTGNEKVCGSTAIFNAIIKNRLHMIKSLTKIGVDINATNIDGQTPLMAAAEYGRTEMVHFLLDNGADARATDVFDQTAIDVASKHGHQNIVELLQRRSGSVPA